MPTAQDLERSLEEIYRGLSACGGYRSIWLDRQGGLHHSEPELELEEEGLRFLACVMRPSREDLTDLLLRMMPSHVVSVARESGTASPVGLIPAIA